MEINGGKGNFRWSRLLQDFFRVRKGLEFQPEKADSFIILQEFFCRLLVWQDA